MNPPKHTTRFSAEQQRECCLMLSMGCDRQTACHYLGKSSEELKQEIRLDQAFRKQLLRAEATPEFNHMRNIYNAAKDEKHWRASVWWLERRSPERYARQSPNMLTSAQLRDLIEELAEAILGEVDDLDNRRRLLARLVKFADEMRSDSFAEQEESPPIVVSDLALRIEQDSEDTSQAPS